MIYPRTYKITEEYARKTIRTCDWLIWIVFSLALVVRGFTILFMVAQTQQTKADIEHIIRIYEANPLAEAIAKLGGVGYALDVVIIPALLMAYYFHMRRKVKQGRAEPDALYFLTQFALMLFITNILNDAAAWLGKLV